MPKSKDIVAPRGQIIWERHNNLARELVEIVTSDKDKKKWFLYNVKNGNELVLKATGSSPLKLKEKKA